MINTIQS